MYCDRRGNGQKPTRTKPPGQKPLRTIEIEFVQGTFVWDFCTRPTKNLGGPRCVTYFRGGVPGYVTKCDRGRGSKLAKSSVTYFMDGPYQRTTDKRSSCGLVVASNWIRSIQSLRFPHIQFASSARDLDILLDPTLTFTNQVNSVSRSYFYHLRQLRSICKSLSLHAYATLVHAMICTRVDFGNAVYIGLFSPTLLSFNLFSMLL